MKISQRLQQRKSSAAVLSSATTVSHAPVDIWLQRLAHLTQVGLLGLGVFGYFYTVLPVFQNQQLQEQAAKLELEKSAAQRHLDELLAAQEKVRTEIATLREGWQREKDKNARLANAADVARKEELAAKQRVAEAESSMTAQMRLLDSARWELVVFDFYSAYIFSSLKATIRPGGKPRDDKPGGFIRKHEAEWPRPYPQLLEAVEAAKIKRATNHQVPATYYSEIKSYVEAHRAELQCAQTDFNALEASYQLQLAALDPSIDAETKASIDKLIKDYADKGQRVEITDDYRQSVRRGVRIGKVFALDRSFEKKLTDMRKVCDDKATAIIEEFRKSKDVAP